MRMQYQTISYIWGVFCLVPFGLEVAGAIVQSVGNRKYDQLDSEWFMEYGYV